MKKLLILLFTCQILFCQMNFAQDKLYSNTFPLSSVRLLDGPFKHAQDLNVTTLLKYDADRFLAPYLKVAGLPPKAVNYPNWESEGLEGHMAGHYLSAMAIHYASTGNIECLSRLNYMVDELKTCQEANSVKYPDWGVGYVGGMNGSSDLWPGIKAGNVSLIWKFWAPWYNLHKTYAGLKDAWLYAGNEEAKTIFLSFCDWAINLTSGLTDNQMQEMLGNEHGGMNEIFADAYQMTGDEKYLATAKRFSHHFLLDPMSTGIDNLDNQHANTQVPKAIGFERIAEVSGDKTYEKAGTFFWETVTGNRSLVFGGNSRQEFFPAEASCIDWVNVVEGPESCNTYNMLKLTEDLFRMHPQACYADYYERALYNHILSTQHPEKGGYVYFTPARPRHYRVYSSPNKCMWCCVGTGMENHGKYGEFIYSHQGDSLFLNLFIASELNWKEKGIKIRQETNFPYEETSRLSITEGSSSFNLLIRYPAWVAPGKMEVRVNGAAQNITSQPSSYIGIDRVWSKGDVVDIILPMHNTIEQMPNVPSYIAFLHGPILLGAKAGTYDLPDLIADSTRWAHIPGGHILPVNEAPVIVEDDRSTIADKLVPVEGSPLCFTAPELHMINPLGTLLFEPFYRIHDSRYMIYWMALSDNQYQQVLDSIAIEEREKIELENRTVDFVQPGQQQPESDHYMEDSNSYSGSNMNEFWREANGGGFFSYQLSTKGETDLTLRLRYWNSEWGKRTFDIYIDDEKLVSVDRTGKWKIAEFVNTEYPLPAIMLEGKKTIRVKFQATDDGTAGGVYFIRLIKQQNKATPDQMNTMNGGK
jgi:uncharacterized protein